MALSTPSSLDSIVNTTNNATIVSNSVSPTGGGLIFAAGSELNSSSTTVSTVTDSFTGTGSWTIYQVELSGGSPTRYLTTYLAWAIAGGTPGSGTVTVTFSGSSRDKTLSVGEITGQHASTPVPQNNTNTGTGASLTVTLAGTPAAASTVIGAIGDRRAAVGITPGGAFTELVEVDGTDIVHEVQYDANSAATTCDWSTLNSIINGAVAIEVQEAAVGGAPVGGLVVGKLIRRGILARGRLVG